MGRLTFTIDLTEVHAIRSWYKKQPRLFQKATGMMLNNFAFGTRGEAIRQIGRTMTVRNAGFVASRMRVTKANLSDPVSRQQSIAGSIAASRFSGWTEQELGLATARNRIGTVASRGGDIQNQMRAGNRLKPGVDAVKIEDYAPRGGNANYGGFIQMLFRRKERGMVKIKKGFYKLPTNARPLPGPTQSGGAFHRQLTLMQEIKRKQPKRNQWLRTARALFFRGTNLGQLWRLTLGTLITTPPPKR